jgi:Domain of unknown function (DUF4135)
VIGLDRLLRVLNTMLHHISLIQLSCRASNLAERLFLLKQLAESSANQQHRVPLTRSDIRAVQQDLESLFPLGADTAPFYRIKRQAMKRSLRLYRWYERNLDQLSASQQQLFVTAHRSWLPIYEKAIATLADPNPLENDQDSAPMLRACGLAGCAPFMKLIETELKFLWEKAEGQGLVISNPLPLIRTVQQFFWQRVGTMVAAIEDRSLDCALAESSLPVEAYAAFYLKYPVLARWLSQVCGDILHFMQQAIARLLADRQDLSHTLWAGVAIDQMTNIRLRQEEMQGQWTMRMDLRLANGQDRQVIYYPYGLEAELGLQKFYAVCEGDVRASESAPYAILSRSGYGYRSTNAACVASPLAQLRQLGQSLAMQQLLGHRGLWSHVRIGVPRLLCGELQDALPQNHALQEGFESLQQWFSTHPNLAMQALNAYCAIATAQLCHRSPGAYLLLLKSAQQSAYLSNPLAVDAVFRVLIDQPCPWDSLGEIAQLEVKMLWQFKTLCLTIPMNHRYMLYDAEHALFSKLPLTPLEFLSRRITQHSTRQYSARQEPASQNAKAASVYRPEKPSQKKDSVSFELAMNA